ncbi:para-nitrobenzyl esterase [Actinoallomurus bryophytorum]|uniref:Para-nitrobenzyl esterase n=1 Tax=Actinoallomurus bryophytorum TaxID=1490222 RepID=A0A543CM72_9ACTN|nr:carboxylesterase/lipase family protein [Actinoallomurus bryophytorum]TQL98208.1 para-nitrobenzyl esterase [Actinoallomurus bryophytorum]
MNTRLGLAAVLGALALTGCAANAANTTTTAKAADRIGCATRTSLGSVDGTAAGGVCAFRGIPYAAPPTGPRRFKPPQPVRPWHGTLKATEGKRVCPQDRDQYSEDYPDDKKEYTNEDCLYLNVWTPRPDRAERPVIVFIHGGAARFGTANEARYDGTTLSTRGDAVVVSLNYRLGVFGWSELGGLDPTYKGSGNNGLRDQMAALRWVHDHIADFGGDPRNVTAVGESEGAFSISAMLATDHPERLFRHAILQSGSGALVHSAAFEKKLAAGFPVRTIAGLKAMSTKQVLALQEKMAEQAPGAAGGALFFGPYVDGRLVRGPVTDRVAAGNARGIDLLMGTDRDEMNFFGQMDPQGLDKLAAQYPAFFPPELAASKKRMVAAYEKDRSPRDAALAMFGDQGMRVPMTRLAQAQSRWRPTYAYEFDWSPPKGVGAVHTIDLPFMFGTLRFTGIEGGDEALAADRARLTRLSGQMVDAWTSFARTGDPNRRRHVARPVWPAYRAPVRSTMVWDLPSRVVNAPRDAERALWDAYPFGPFTM